LLGGKFIPFFVSPFSCSRCDLQLVAKTKENSVERVHRLHVQKQSVPEGATALDDDLSRWLLWTTAGLKNLTLNSAFAAIET
jgi:hypothetical protein